MTTFFHILPVPDIYLMMLDTDSNIRLLTNKTIFPYDLCTGWVRSHHTLYKGKQNPFVSCF